MGFVPDNTPGMPGQAPHRPGGAARNVIVTPSLSIGKILPVFGERKELLGKGFLIPGIFTAITVALMFYTLGNAINQDNSINPAYLLQYCDVIAVYIGAGLLFVVYRLCGKSKPWWLIFAPVAFTYFWLTAGGAHSPFQMLYSVFSIFGEPNDNDPNLLHKLFQFTFTVGVREELSKALPVLLLFFFASKLASPLREKVGIFEPIDGIILGAASGLGFTFGETLGQYVPNIIGGVAQQTGNLGTGAMMGVMLVSARLLSEIMGHLAYSGCFGYFIGLAALMPKHKWKLLGLGLLTAIVLHGFWDATANTPLMMVIEGAISYAFLIAAILKARQLSPDRAHNFATQIKGVP
jgi:RsiW-degrading membrane proteinase PrsW (M82 family)